MGFYDIYGPKLSVADLKAKAKRLRSSVETMRQTLSVSFDKRWSETVKHG